MNNNFDSGNGSRPQFEFFDVTADAGYLAYGSTLEESFENAGLAMLEVMTRTSQIQKVEKREIEVKSEDKVSLLYDYLEELIFLHDVEFMVFSDFKVNIKKEGEDYILHGLFRGEKFNPEIHERRDEVKAVTFHMMEVIEENGYRVRVILDL